MKIVIDEIIPHGAKAFSSLGEVISMPGRQMSPENVKDADILIVRTVTRVNRNLFEDSSVRFVGAATIGTDHLDLEYLESQGIGYASAPGCNAVSVAEYVTAALLETADYLDQSSAGKTLGVIGVGNVGSKVVRQAKALGMEVLENDPPLSRKAGDNRFVSLDHLLKESDIITLHTPLTREGVDATYHLADRDFFNKMKPGSLFINSSRGKVVDESALAEALASGQIRAAVLDVWETEPWINATLAENVLLATAHIAGYSFDGRLRGLEMVYRAACSHFNIPPTWSAGKASPPPEDNIIPLDTLTTKDVIRRAYDIRKDDRMLRELITLPREEQQAEFDRLHREYRRRREFSNYKVMASENNQKEAEVLSRLGFQLILPA
jgi:erythronate-4-phosphate dehydrogenase